MAVTAVPLKESHSFTSYYLHACHLLLLMSRLRKVCLSPICSYLFSCDDKDLGGGVILHPGTPIACLTIDFESEQDV
jgi:hypothetical protein